MDDDRRDTVGSGRVIVWAVCENEWESNGPVAVFATEALANEHCHTLNTEPWCHGSYDVRPLPLLDALPQKTTWFHRQARIRLADGTVEHFEQEPRPGWPYDHDNPELLVVEPRGAVVINAWATSDEVALATCDEALKAELAKHQ